MKTFILGVIVLALSTFLTARYLPWYAPVLPAILVGYVLQWKSAKAFFAGFLSAFLLYGLIAFLIDQSNAQILSTRIGQLFNGISGFSLILISAFSGGILVGLGAASGAAFKHFVHSKR